MTPIETAAKLQHFNDWRPELIITDWLPMRCGHSTRASDAACEGCTNRRENNGEVLSKSLDQLPATS